nr:hypothetical protein [Desulfobacterales bacterium]
MKQGGCVRLKTKFRHGIDGATGREHIARKYSVPPLCGNGFSTNMLGVVFMVIRITCKQNHMYEGISHNSEVAVGSKTLPYKYCQLTKVMAVCSTPGLHVAYNYSDLC